MVTPGSAGVGGTHRCRRALRCWTFCEPRLVEMFEQPHVADRIERDPAGEHKPVRAGQAQEMIDHMDHRILEHQLRRGRLVETIFGVGPMMDVLDPQHGVRIPELIGFERLSENRDQRRMVGIVIRDRSTSWPSHG